MQVLLHLKSLRANVCGLPTVEAAISTIGELAADRDRDPAADWGSGLAANRDGDPPRDVRLRVHLHHDVLDPSSSVHDPALVQRLLELAARSDSRCDLHIHHYLGDKELHELYATADVVVLPYRFGTHSGLIELCRDVGTRVVVPAIGGYEDQGAHHVYAIDEGGEPDRGSFAAALRAAILAPAPAPLDVATRVRQRQLAALGHLEVYERAITAARRRVVSAPVASSAIPRPGARPITSQLTTS